MLRWLFQFFSIHTAAEEHAPSASPQNVNNLYTTERFYFFLFEAYKIEMGKLIHYLQDHFLQLAQFDQL